MLFCIFQLQLAYLYLINKNHKVPELNSFSSGYFPSVTIQLPVFNELYMAERLIDNIAKINYPENKLQIQVLDDSTDETTEIIIRRIEELKEDCKIEFSYIHRSNRTGFKAGALKEALNTARGELIAIFDADFLPEPDFLIKTVPYFSDDKIGAVQTRWGHLNKNFSLLTRLQAFALDVHFTIEKIARESKNYFIEFNGTSGIWRKAAIYDAGNWQSDTLTEDLDISYRSQLKGWKIKYLKDVVTPAELPVEMNAIKVQQFRWMKGGAQNFIKNHKKLLKAPIPFMTKINGLFYLLSSTVFIFSFLVAILTYPVMMIQIGHPELKHLFSAALIFTPLGIFPFFYYGIAYFSVNNSSWKSILLFPFYFFCFFIMILGLSLHNVIAVSEAFLGITSSFLRTPKFNNLLLENQWKKNKYLSKNLSLISLIEFLLAVFFFWCIVNSIHIRHYTFLSFYIVLFLGYSLVSFLSLRRTSL
jgi:cellulose synthase/poly-beta-1,6-N-acetylglucosamine synthase-like glycosyltransferase